MDLDLEDIQHKIVKLQIIINKMEKHLYFQLIRKRNIIFLFLSMLFIVLVIALLLEEDMILQLMNNLKLLVQVIVIFHIHIQEERKTKLMEEIVHLLLLNVKFIILNMNNLIL